MKEFLQEAEEPPPLLHPNMAHHYHVQVDELYAALQEDSEAKRMTAADLIRSLVKDIILTPEDGELQIDVRGDLAGILAISLKSKRPAGGAGRSQVEMVAGTGFDQNLRTQKSRPVGAADLRDLASQFEMVAGPRSNLHLLPEQVKMVAGTHNHLYLRLPLRGYNLPINLVVASE